MYVYIHVFIYLFCMKVTLCMCIYIHIYVFIYLFPIKSTHCLLISSSLLLSAFDSSCGKATSEAAWEVGHRGRPRAALGAPLKAQGMASILATSSGQEGSRTVPTTVAHTEGADQVCVKETNE